MLSELTDNMIKIRNLRKQFSPQYPGRGFCLHVDNLEIGDGEVVYFLGPNGSGKTTLLSIVRGTIPADSGSVLIESGQHGGNLDLLEFDPHSRAKYLGVVPQDSDEALVNEMTVADHVLVALSQSASVPLLFPRMRLRSSVESVLSGFRLGLEHRLNESVGNLSGGERQVLTFCLATVGKPAVMLLDEFTSALDPEMARKVIDTVISFLRSNRLTALVVTHRHKEALDNADRIVVLHHGRPFCDVRRGSPDFTEECMREIFSSLYEIRDAAAVAE